MHILNEMEPKELGLIGKPFTKDELVMGVERLSG